METNEKCPRCKEGKLVERISYKDEEDVSESFVMGIAIGCGYFRIMKQVKYLNYSCGENCGYRAERKLK